jgi:hypothetical protein
MRDTVALTLLVLSVAASGCASIAIATAPDKTPSPDDSRDAKEADAAFWSIFHSGDYEHIQSALDKLEGAYLAHPTDHRTAAHIALLHLWRVSERARQESIAPTITDDISMARRYFDEAVQLQPKDARYQGFLAATTMGEGKVHAFEKEQRRGFFAMNDAVDAWPEFNLFTRGYVMSNLPYDSSRYADAVEDQWKNLDVCAKGAHVDRETGDFSPYMKLETRTGWKRVCWDSWIAPHNFEGFFLNMGDMIVKAGNPAVARNVYAQARLAQEFASWPYRDVLARRIAQADENVALFRAPPSHGDKERRIMNDTPFSCMGCHQQ